MIDKETLRFLGWIQRLTKASAEGFFPFSEVTKTHQASGMMMAQER